MIWLSSVCVGFNESLEKHVSFDLIMCLKDFDISIYLLSRVMY